MRPSVRRGAMVLAFFAGVAWVFGTKLVRSEAGPDAGTWTNGHADMETVGALTRGAARPRREAFEPLTDEERGQIFDVVIRIADVPVADVDPPEPSAAVPAWVELQDLPAVVARLIPRVDGMKFVKLDDRILLVNPASRRVVSEMPRYKLVLQ